MARHLAGHDLMGEDNPNPALRPSVDRLFHLLKTSAVLNKDEENALYIIEKLIDWFFYREMYAAITDGREKDWMHKFSLIQRLALKLQNAWMHGLSVRSRDWA